MNRELFRRMTQRVAARFCGRCAMGHPVWPPGTDGADTHTHGMDETEPGSGVYAPPEGCWAMSAWALFDEMDKAGILGVKQKPE